MINLIAPPGFEHVIPLPIIQLYNFRTIISFNELLKINKKINTLKNLDIHPSRN